MEKKKAWFHCCSFFVDNCLHYAYQNKFKGVGLAELGHLQLSQATSKRHGVELKYKLNTSFKVL